MTFLHDAPALGPNIAGSISACSKMTMVINSFGTDWAVPWWTQPLTPVV